MLLTIAVEDVLELGERRWDLQPHIEDLLLALEADVGRPSHHAREVALGLNILTDAIVAGTLLEERVLCTLEPISLRAVGSTYLGRLLGAAGLALWEGSRRRFLSLWWHLVVEAVIENRNH